VGEPVIKGNGFQGRAGQRGHRAQGASQGMRATGGKGETRMLKALFCTADSVTAGTGGGNVCLNELQALREFVNGVGSVVVIEGKDINPANYRQPDSPFLYDFFALQLVKGQHFDLAHFYSGTFTQTISWLKSRGTKVTYTCPAHDRKVSVEEFQRLGLEYPFHHIKDDDLWNIYSEGHRLADVVITPSNMSARVMKDEGCKNVVMIPHGCDLPNRVKSVPKDFTASYVGQIGPDKGVIYLILAWGMLGYDDAKLILAGQGTEILEPTIRSLVDAGGFQLMGYVQNPGEVYDTSSVYIQPSVEESFGIPILEAMAHGRPVIASEGAGASELVDGGGFVVPRRDPKAIADKVSYLKNNPNLVGEMGRNAREKAKNYTWAKIRRQYGRVWASL